MHKLMENKWFKFSKYLTAGILILVAIIALLASWFAGYAKINNSANDANSLQKIYAIKAVTDYSGLRGINLAFGIISLILAIVLLSVKKNTTILVTYGLSFAMIILLLTTSSVAIDTTHWVKF